MLKKVKFTLLYLIFIYFSHDKKKIMKKLLFSSLVLLIAANVQAQSKRQIIPAHLKQAHKIIKANKEEAQVNLHTSRVDYAPTASEYTLFSNGMSEEVIGTTYYDLQTNSSVQNRLFVQRGWVV